MVELWPKVVLTSGPQSQKKSVTST